MARREEVESKIIKIKNINVVAAEEAMQCWRCTERDWR
jgi:hypothetical protein